MNRKLRHFAKRVSMAPEYILVIRTGGKSLVRMAKRYKRLGRLTA